LRDFRKCGKLTAAGWQLWVKTCIPQGVTLKDGLQKGNFTCRLKTEYNIIVITNLTLRGDKSKIEIPISYLLGPMKSTSIITGLGFAETFTQYSSSSEDCRKSLGQYNHNPSMKVTIGKDGSVGV
jgi:hypothetical protein